MTTMTELPSVTSSTAVLRSLALDITRTCQAACDHCYNSSSPAGTAGEMTRADWLSVLGQAAAMGVHQVQFIGGEPTLHPDLPDLINHAVDLGLAVEVFSNLIHIRPAMWRTLGQRGVTVATSYYSDDATEHEAITHHRGSYKRTRANIAKAISFRIPVRAALVDVLDGQRLEQAAAELRALGVKSIRTDRLRGIGRGAGESDAHDVSELCGNCTRGRAAVLPSGDVAGCVMSGGMMSAGNVRTTPLALIIGNEIWREFAAKVPRQGADPCVPDSCTPREDSCQPSPGSDLRDDVRATACNPGLDGCGPDSRDDCGPDDRLTVHSCNPDSDGSDCAPAESEACGPAY